MYFLILSSLYLIISVVSFAGVSTTYANFVSSTNHFLSCHHDFRPCFDLPHYYAIMAMQSTLVSLLQVNLCIKPLSMHLQTSSQSSPISSFLVSTLAGYPYADSLPFVQRVVG